MPVHAAHLLPGAWLGLLFAGAAFFVLLNPRLMLLFPVALVGLYFVLPPS